MSAVLLAAAGRNGAALDVALRLRAALDRCGVAGDVHRLDAPAGFPRPGDYRAVVLGSVVRGGGWLPAASCFVAAHSDVLCLRPLWVYSCEPVVALRDNVHRVEVKGFAGGAAGLVSRSFVARRGRPATGADRAPAPRAVPDREIGDWAREIAAALDRAAVRTA